jgi:2-oxoisovalerate dehydrogenase E1 component beta subunit
MAVMTMARAIRNALRVELTRDERVLVFGEDVGKKGGVFTVTEGLQEEFGRERVFDTPLDENGILGLATGLALMGLRPVAEIQFVDFLWPGFDVVISDMAKYRFRSGGQFSVPMVVRAPYGGEVKGGLYHSQSPEAIFGHISGLKVVIPSTPREAKGLLISSIRDEDPVIFLEPKKIYFALKEEVEEGDFTIPLGRARIVKEGSDVTVVSYGYMLHRVLKVAEEMEERGISLEVIDLRTIVPYDGETILNSVVKTGKLVVVVEAPRILSVASEISAFVAERAIDYLEGPIVRVAGWDTPFPYALEKSYMPGTERIKRGIERALSLVGEEA